MDEGSSRWHEITPSSFAPERGALRHVRDLLPDRHPYAAWSNFTFISQHGHVREVDLLVVSPGGLHLIEIKNLRGELSNRYNTWVQQRPGGSRRAFDNPLLLADQKAKELKSLLVQAARQDHINIPFVSAAIFLAEPGTVCRLDDAQRNHVYGLDSAPQNPNTLPRIGADLLLGPTSRTPPSPEFFRSLPRLLERVGIHRTQRSVTVGQWTIEPRPYESGPTWQDHHASRADLPGEYRRIRIYLYEREADPDKQRSIRAAAEREFRACQGIQHPGLLRPTDFVDHEAGPALLIEQAGNALRLDHYIVQHHAELDLPARLDVIRQLAEAVNYAHERRLVHRALAPRAVIVEPTGNDWAQPRLRVGEWQAAARGLSGTSTLHQLRPSTGAVAHIEAAAAPYLAPDFAEEVDGTVAIDVFGVGAIAYLVLTGRPPAATRAEMLDQLAAQNGLHPRAVDDGIPDDVDALVALATAPVVRDRFTDMAEFLEQLDEVSTASDDESGTERSDPWSAGRDDNLGDTDYVVQKVLGTGATARAFLVLHDNMETVLKVSRSAEAEERLLDEAAALEHLRHDHIVVLRRGVFGIGNRQAIEIDFAGERSLGQMLRADGALLPDQLQRLGDQLLDALAYLEKKGVFHRDIKPDNLGVRNHPKHGQGLVLFDFSLAGAPANDLVAGTRGYVDPFLDTDRRPRYDFSAERYAAAVTLHEMASLELPTWGEDGTNPRFMSSPAIIAGELFEAPLREPLVAFFTKALHRDAEQRFGSAAAMRAAWERVFISLDETGPAAVSSSGSDNPVELRNEAAARAGLDTALDAAGLTLRAIAVAHRLNVNTVGELLDLPQRAIRRARGQSAKTREELLARTTEWRRTLIKSVEPIDSAELAADVDATRLPLDSIVAMLLPKPRRRTDTPLTVSRLLLGLPEGTGELPDPRWPTNVQVATSTSLSPGRIAQILALRRKAWLATPALDVVRGELEDALVSLRRVAGADELADHLLALHGCSENVSPDHRRAYAHAVLRAAFEADWLLAEPRFRQQRHHGRVLVALQVGADDPVDTPSDAALLELAVGLAKRAEDLIQEDPLPTPTAVVRELSACAERVGELLDEKRLVRLATAASGAVLANVRLELYPRDLPLVRALRLAQAGAGLPERGLTAEMLQQRVDSRFPNLARLPAGQALRDMLDAAGFTLVFDGDVYRPPHAGLTAVTPEPDSSSASQHVPFVEGTAAADVDARLVEATRHGGVRVITVRRRRWARARAAVENALGEPMIDVSSAFVAALRNVAADLRIPDFGRVLHADAAEPGSNDQLNLQRVVSQACELLEQDWSRRRVLALDSLTPFGRYPAATVLLERLTARARYGAGTEGLAGPDALVLLSPAGDETQPPRIGEYTIRINTPEEWVIARSTWLPERARTA